MQTPSLVPATPAARAAQGVIRRIALVALGAIGLGFLMQCVLVLARLLAAGPAPGAGVLAELAGTVSWSVLVCTGVAIGVSLGSARAALAGLFGVVFAPLGLAAAKAAQKMVASVVEASTSPALLSVETVGVVRAMEYGVLAFVLALLSERKVVKLPPYLLLGAGVGAVFGGFLVVLTALADSLSGRGRDWPMLAGSVVSEVAFPIGCALLIYVAQLIRHSHRIVQGGAMGVMA